MTRTRPLRLVVSLALLIGVLTVPTILAIKYIPNWKDWGTVLQIGVLLGSLVAVVRLGDFLKEHWPDEEDVDEHR